MPHNLYHTKPWEITHTHTHKPFSSATPTSESCFSAVVGDTRRPPWGAAPPVPSHTAVMFICFLTDLDYLFVHHCQAVPITVRTSLLKRITGKENVLTTPATSQPYPQRAPGRWEANDRISWTRNDEMGAKRAALTDSERGDGARGEAEVNGIGVKSGGEAV